MANLTEALTKDRIHTINASLIKLNAFLRSTFFLKQTGLFWTYLEMPDLFTIGDSEMETSGEQVIRDISNELGPKINYVREAHLLLGNILLLMTWCELALEENPIHESIETIMDIDQRLIVLKKKLDELLNTSDAFAVNIDVETGEWSIEDVHLDAQSILLVWDNLYENIVGQD